MKFVEGLKSMQCSFYFDLRSLNPEVELFMNVFLCVHCLLAEAFDLIVEGRHDCL